MTKGFVTAVAVAMIALIGVAQFTNRHAQIRVDASISALQVQVAALTARLADQEEWSKSSDRQIMIQRDALARLRLDLDALMARRPPPVETRWIENRFNRHEQRIGNLEYARWGIKP